MEDEDDIDGTEEREAMGMVLGDLGNSVKAMRKKRLSKPLATITIASGGDDGKGLDPNDPMAEGDLSDDELAKLEALC